MISFQHYVGRLIEVRVVAPIVSQDLEAGDATRRALVTSLAERPVMCMDLRQATTMSPDAADAVQRLMTRHIHAAEREALLLPPTSATMAMQLNRLLRSAGSDTRRVFDTADDVGAWLGEVLTVHEQVRLRAFLHGAAHATSARG